MTQNDAHQWSQTFERAGCEKLRKEKYYIYLYFLLRPAALQSSLLAEANVPGPGGLIPTETRRPQVLPPPPSAARQKLPPIASRCADTHALPTGVRKTKLREYY